MSLDTYRLMVVARQFEEQLRQIFADGKLGGWFHSCAGHEATGAAIAACLGPLDHLVPYHRSRVSVLGKGMPLEALALEMMGRGTSPTLGRAGETHINHAASRIYGTTGVLGANIPIASGVAYAVQLQGADEVVVVGFGDGTTNRGAFHEGLNLAAIWDLPVVFVCENNLYAEFSAMKDQMRITDIADRAGSYGMPGIVVDGNDVDAAFEVLSTAVARARAGDGPTLVEAKTYRQRGHYEGDPESYRDAAEVAEWAARDPLILSRRRLLEQGTSETELETLEAEATAEVAAAMDHALAAPMPTEAEAFGAVCA
ncbi:MAG: acetoin:2,6-dichlorophenolindophenol oxidoreductase subunit alpha [Solirubrobacteraceae bacterium]|jgi:pyruvate dehydrogenase E1 component alpha subunit|nr:acetoin:2,6-dichlorophenolindophenol oxidoreductase subunit alpha [Solirubrobacteraceae bacterium]